jgi:hypothetical protein
MKRWPQTLNAVQPMVEKLAQKQCTTRSPACHMNIKAVKAWATNARAHLGRNEPKWMPVVHRQSMVERSFQQNKTDTRLNDGKP